MLFRSQGDFLAALKRAGVARVIDIRALPLSRRPGFSKTPLRNALAEEGIGYVHLKALGTPAAGREAPGDGRQPGHGRLAPRGPSGDRSRPAGAHAPRS